MQRLDHLARQEGRVEKSRRGRKQRQRLADPEADGEQLLGLFHAQDHRRLRAPDRQHHRVIEFVAQFEHDLDRKIDGVHRVYGGSAEFDALGPEPIMACEGVAVDKAHADEADEIAMRLAGRHSGGLREHLELMRAAAEFHEGQQQLHAGLDRVDPDLAVARAFGRASRFRGGGVTRPFAFHDLVDPNLGDPIDGIINFEYRNQITDGKTRSIARASAGASRAVSPHPIYPKSSNGIGGSDEASTAAWSRQWPGRDFRFFVAVKRLICLAKMASARSV